MPPAQPERDVEPLPRATMVLLIVAGGTFLNTLAGSSINLALPALGRELGLPIELSRWVVLAALLSVTAVLLPAGRLGDIVGHRRVYLSGFLLFGGASLAAGLAHTFPTLLFARVTQGIGGALVMAAGPALITTSLPASRRGRSLGILATATYVGLTLGPPIGGWILEMLDWRWVFYVNVPVAVLMVSLGRIVLSPARPTSSLSFDLPGAVTLLLGSPLLLIAITEGPSWGWTSTYTLASAGAGAASLVLFVTIERSRPEPILRLALFRSRVFTVATLSALCNYVALFVPTFLLPYYLLEGKSYSQAAAGLLLSFQPLAMALIASPSGWLSDRIGTRVLASAGLGISAVGIALLARSVAPEIPPGSGTILALTSVGLGTGLFISPNSNALMGAAPREQQGVAGAVMAVARNLGMVLGVSSGTEVFHAFGGRSHRPWTSQDFHALRLALLIAAAVSVLGSLITLTARETSRSGSHPAKGKPADKDAGP